jgi:hypothetical protein
MQRKPPTREEAHKFMTPVTSPLALSTSEMSARLQIWPLLLSNTQCQQPLQVIVCFTYEEMKMANLGGMFVLG